MPALSVSEPMILQLGPGFAISCRTDRYTLYHTGPTRNRHDSIGKFDTPTVRKKKIESEKEEEREGGGSRRRPAVAGYGRRRAFEPRIVR